MSKEEKKVKKEKKGRLAWLITVLEIIILIAYFLIAFGGIASGFMGLNIGLMFESVIAAIWFLVIATAVLTILCFVPVFKSKGNIRWAIWNIIWIAFSVYSLISLF